MSSEDKIHIAIMSMRVCEMMLYLQKNNDPRYDAAKKIHIDAHNARIPNESIYATQDRQNQALLEWADSKDNMDLYRIIQVSHSEYK
jgi:hypothetical protein